jgi:hypothetical protein
MSHKSTVSAPIDDLDSWEELSEDVPVPEWHLEVLDERLAKLNDQNEGFKTWKEFRDELTQK